MERKSKREILKRIKNLESKEEELLSYIKLIDDSLIEKGYPIEDIVYKIRSEKGKMRTGIRINNKLSFRGKQKSEEYFDLIDIDKDNLLNFEDMKAMNSFHSKFSFYKVSEDFASIERWKASMNDLGIRLSDKACIDKKEFKKYRELIEADQPLEKELDYFKLGYLPYYLNEVSKCKKLLSELKEYKETRNNKKKNEREFLEIEDISYIINNLGYSYKKPEIASFMLTLCQKKSVLIELCKKYAKKNLSDPNYSYILNNEDHLELHQDPNSAFVKADEFVRVESKDFFPWFIGVPSFFNFNAIYRNLLYFKYKFWRGVRLVDLFSRKMFTLAAHLNDRLVFRDFVPLAKLTRYLLENYTYKFGMTIGNSQNVDKGISGNWKLVKIESSGQTLKNYKVPVDSGVALAFDLLFQFDVTEEEKVYCVEVIKRFLLYHLEKELRGNTNFNGLNVFSTLNENDSSSVLRISLSYKRVVSLDGFLAHMLIPYTMTDLVNVFVGDFKSSIELSELIRNGINNFNEIFCASFDFTLGFKRNLVVSLLERANLAFTSALTKEQSEFLDQADEDAATVSTVEEEEKNRRVLRWYQIHSYFPWLASVCENALKLIRGIHNLVYRIKFTSLSDFVYKTSFFNYKLNHYFSDKFLYQEGYCKELYQKFSNIYFNEFKTLHSTLTEYLKNKKKDVETKRREKLLNSINLHSNPDGLDNSQLQTLEKMRRLGIDASDTDQLFAEENDNPDIVLKSIVEDNRKNDILGLQTLECLQKYFTGLHSTEVVSGKSRLTLYIQGLDFLELLPKLPSIKLSLDEYKIADQKIRK